VLCRTARRLEGAQRPEAAAEAGFAGREPLPLREASRYIFEAVSQVLVLNASYEPLNVTSVRRAHVLVFKGKAEVLEELDQPLRSASDTFQWPHVIRLVQYVRVPRAVQRKISRRALFARDDWRCVYCGTTSGRLTLDHVVPRSRGGDSVWENVVTSCAPCNLKKGNRLLEEASMKLMRPPRPPQPVLFIRLAAPKIPHGWRQYLPDVAESTA
jgi:5-methylcytosine-specific restriction endonuclease McrA